AGNHDALGQRRLQDDRGFLTRRQLERLRLKSTAAHASDIGAARDLHSKPAVSAGENRSAILDRHYRTGDRLAIGRLYDTAQRLRKRGEWHEDQKNKDTHGTSRKISGGLERMEVERAA